MKKQEALVGRPGIYVVLGLLALLAAFGLAACGGGSSSSSTESTEATETTEASSGGEAGEKESGEGETGAIDGEGKKIAFLTFGFGNSYSDNAAKGAREEAEKLNVSVEVFDGKFDPGNQASQCQDAITSGRFAAIAVGAIAGPTMVPCAAQAKAAGIPLVAWADAIGTSSTSAVPTEPGVVANVLTPITTLYGGLAESVGEACETVEGPCKIVNLADLELQPEVSGVYTKELEKVEKEVPNAEVVEEPESGLEVSTGQTAMQDILAKGTEFNVLTAPGAQTMKGALIALKSAGKSIGNTGDAIRVVAPGSTESQMKGIVAGEIFSTSTTLPLTEGRSAIEVATLAALGKPFPKSTIAPEVEGLPITMSVNNESEWEGFEGQWSE